jgi:hypothetical protein
VRSLLFEPWDRSRKASWLLLLATALIAIALGFLVWRTFRPTAAPAATGASAAGPSIAVDPQALRSGTPGIHVLFIGNSLTSFWEVPELVKQMAADDTTSHARLLVAQYAPGGSRLSQAAEYPGE